MGWGTHREVRDESGALGEIWDGSGDPRGGLGRVGGLSGRSANGSGDPRGSLGQVWEPSGRSFTGRGTLERSVTGRGILGEVWNGSLQPLWRSETGWWTLGRSGTDRRIHLEVRDESGDTWGDLGRVEGPLGGPERVGGPSGRSKMG